MAIVIVNSCLAKAHSRVNFIALINHRYIINHGGEPVLQYNFVQKIVYIRRIKLNLVI